jgi:hypothetical protein
MWDASMMNWRKQQDEMTWRKHFAALLEFHTIHGHCDIPVNLEFECDLSGGIGHYIGKTGKWLLEQRNQTPRRRVPYKLTLEQERLYQQLVLGQDQPDYSRYPQQIMQHHQQRLAQKQDQTIPHSLDEQSDVSIFMIAYVIELV